MLRRNFLFLASILVAVVPVTGATAAPPPATPAPPTPPVPTPAVGKAADASTATSMTMAEVNELQRRLAEETLRLSSQIRDPAAASALDGEFLVDVFARAAMEDPQRRTAMAMPAESLGLTKDEAAKIAEALGRPGQALNRADILETPDALIERITGRKGEALLHLRLTAAGMPTRAERHLELKGVSFEYDSAELTAEAQRILDSVADRLVSSGETKDIEVQGHTSSEGSAKYNQALSERRAQSVADYIKGKGVTNNLYPKGYGKDYPIADNDTEEGRAKNRRVVLIFMYSQPKGDARNMYRRWPRGMYKV